MEKSSKIFIAGHRGMVGRAVIRKLEACGYTDLRTASRSDVDLTNAAETDDYFQESRPEVVINAAAKVGGIHANNTYPAEFLRDNLAIGLNLVHGGWKAGVKRLLNLGSTCIYPREAPQPMPEDCLLSSPLEKTNEAYALSKITTLKLCEYYRKQYGALYHSAMPTNLYGTGDNYHPENSHVLPGLIRRFHQAKTDGVAEVSVWGSGNPRREFLHVDDLAEAVLHLLVLPNPPDWVNVGTSEDCTIRELAEMVKEAVGFTGELTFDPTKPDGTPRKLTDTTRIRETGWEPRISLKTGIERTYREFCEDLKSGEVRL